MTIDDFSVASIVEKLSVEEKASLLSGVGLWRTKALPHHNIPSLLLSDGPNGVRGEKLFDMEPSGCFPCGTGLASTFDNDLLFETGKMMAREAKAKGVNVILGPTVNMQRSPLGGRGFESFSEDPVLSGLAASSIINGIQSEGCAATIKHFVCNDQEHERTSMDAVVSQRALREVYLLPFQIAIRGSNPKAVMTSYNKVNGVHASQDNFLLKDILRGEWNWKGLIMSDWGGTYSMKEALEAGLDLEMPGPSTWRGKLITNAIANRELSMSVLNERVTQMLEFIYDVYKTSHCPEPKSNDTPETSSFLRKLATDSIVLLKNENQQLPLDKSKKTAVIGPNAKYTVFCGGGSASLYPYYAISPLDGVKSKTIEEPLYNIGLNTFKSLPLLDEYLTTEDGTHGVDVKIFDLPFDDPQRNLIDTKKLGRSQVIFADYFPPIIKNKSLFYADIEGTFIPDETAEYEFELIVIGTANLYVDNELVVDNSTNQVMGDAFFGLGTRPELGTIKLTRGKSYKISIRYGTGLTSKIITPEAAAMLKGAVRVGAIRKTQSINESIAEAVEVAKKVDQVVLSLGLNSAWETEGHDRENMDLPPGTTELVKSIVAANPNTVVVMQSGTPVTMPWIDDVPAVIHAWYGGNETGNAIADVLFGDANPNGKLSLTIPKRLEDNPSYLYFGSEHGRTWYGEHVYVGYKFYETIDRPVLFPFGHGLSYTKFNYTNCTVSLNEDNLTVTVDVKNTGNMEGKESVQIYISSANLNIRRPFKELKGYNKVNLLPGETKTVSIAISKKYATSYWDEERNQWVSEKGNYIIHCASSSVDVRLTRSFELNREIRWNGL